MSLEWITVMTGAATLVTMVSVMIICLQCRRRKSSASNPPEENIRGIENLTYYESDVKVIYNPQSGALELASGHEDSRTGAQDQYISGTFPESPVCHQIHAILAAKGQLTEITEAGEHTSLRSPQASEYTAGLQASQLTQEGQKRFEQIRTPQVTVPSPYDNNVVTMETGPGIETDVRKESVAVGYSGVSRNTTAEHEGYSDNLRTAEGSDLSITQEISRQGQMVTPAGELHKEHMAWSVGAHGTAKTD